MQSAPRNGIKRKMPVKLIKRSEEARTRGHDDRPAAMMRRAVRRIECPPTHRQTEKQHYWLTDLCPPPQISLTWFVDDLLQYAVFSLCKTSLHSQSIGCAGKFVVLLKASSVSCYILCSLLLSHSATSSLCVCVCRWACLSMNHSWNMLVWVLVSWCVEESFTEHVSGFGWSFWWDAHFMEHECVLWSLNVEEFFIKDVCVVSLVPW